MSVIDARVGNVYHGLTAAERIAMELRWWHADEKGDARLRSTTPDW